MTFFKKFTDLFRRSTQSEELQLTEEMAAAVPRPAPTPLTKQEPTVKAPAPRATPIPPPAPMTRKQQARCFYEAGQWNNLHTFKRKQKKGWAALGFNPSEIQEIKLHIGD